MAPTSDEKVAICMIAIGIILLAASIYPINQGNNDMEKYRDSPKDETCRREGHNTVYYVPCSEEYEEATNVFSLGIALACVGGIFIFVTLMAIFNNPTVSKRKQSLDLDNVEVKIKQTVLDMMTKGEFIKISDILNAAGAVGWNDYEKLIEILDVLVDEGTLKKISRDGLLFFKKIVG